MTQDTIFACDALGGLYQHNAQLLLANKELLARCDILNNELEQAKDKIDILETELYQMRA